MLGKERFFKKRKGLELIDALDKFSLYYDPKDKSLWVWDGKDFFGISAEDFYKDLMMYIPWKHLFVDEKCDDLSEHNVENTHKTNKV